MIRFPSIEQFKNTIRAVQHSAQFQGLDENGKAIMDRPVSLPTLKFTGRVKIHGTNAGIRLDLSSGQLVAQSRERELSIDSDNAGFCMFTMQNKDYFLETLQKVAFDYQLSGDDKVVVFGEWAGGNIQSGVAINGLPKFFAIFGLRVIKGESDIWLNEDQIAGYFDSGTHERNIYLVREFGEYEVEIDFNRPELSQNKLVELTDAVEKECPVGKYFGKSGIGEGVVYSYSGEFGRHCFKVKGEAHSNSKVKTTAPVDEAKFNNAKAFAENYVTDARIEQGFTWLKVEGGIADPDFKDVGSFIRWVTGDVMKEEQNGIVENNIDTKILAKEIANIARTWYLAKM